MSHPDDIIDAQEEQRLMALEDKASKPTGGGDMKESEAVEKLADCVPD